MENSEIKETTKAAELDDVKLGTVIIGFGKLTRNISIFSDIKFFLAKYGFYSILVDRAGKSFSLNSDQLQDNDVLEDIGMLRWPLKISSIHQIEILRKIGVKVVYVLPKSLMLNRDDFLSAVPVPLRKKSETSRTSKKASMLLAELHQFQDKISEVEKIQEQGYELLQDIFTQGNFQPISVHGIEKLAARIYNYSADHTKASQVLMLLKDHDDYTFRHCVDVTNQLTFILKYMGSYSHQAMQDLAVAALLHDIGKVKVPIEILNKRGRFDDSEWSVMKKHPVYSAEIMKRIGLNNLQISVGHFHHLRKNGTGYPLGFEYDKLPEAVRLTMIVDVYQALVTLRPYRKPETPYAAITKIHSWSGVLFDSWLVDVFIKAFGLYPIGSFVRLNDFRYGFIIANDKYTLRPTVMVCFDKDKLRISMNEMIDLSLPDNYLLEINSVVDHRDFFKNNEALDFFMNMSS